MRGPSPRLRVWATLKLRGNGDTMHDLTSLGIEPRTTVSVGMYSITAPTRFGYGRVLSRTNYDGWPFPVH